MVRVVCKQVDSALARLNARRMAVPAVVEAATRSQLEELRAKLDSAAAEPAGVHCYTVEVADPAAGRQPLVEPVICCT